MKFIPVNKLVDISAHSNEVIRLSDFLIKAGLDIRISALAQLEPEADQVSLLEALDKDINNTAQSIEKVLKLISTVDDKDIVHHIKNSENNLCKIFGDSYNSQTKTLSFNKYSLNIVREYSKLEIKALIVESMTGLSIEEYKELRLKMKNLFKFNDASLSSDFEKVQYLSVIKHIERYEDIIKSIREITSEYNGFRLKLGSGAREKLDTITFERAMIDSVVNTSSYISKIVGYEQISRKHKDENKFLDLIRIEIDKSQLIDAVEIDQDANLDAMLNVLVKLNSVKPNFSNDALRIILKARKLGNYNANGLFVVNANILAVDINSPSSIMHELSHAVYYNNDVIYNSPATKMMIAELKNQMDIETFREQSTLDAKEAKIQILGLSKEREPIVNEVNRLKGLNSIETDLHSLPSQQRMDMDARLVIETQISEAEKKIEDIDLKVKRLKMVTASVNTSSRQEYLLRDTEVFARMGEVGFLLNQYNYTEEEGLDLFSERVREIELENFEENVFNINMNHPIDHYLGHEVNNNLINENEVSALKKLAYFNLKDMEPSMLSNIKKFSRCMFSVNGQQPENINDFYHEKKISITNKKERAPSMRYEPKSISLFDSPDNISFALNFNQNEKLIDPRILLSNVFTQMTHLNRTTNGLKEGITVIQKDIVKAAVNWAQEKNDPRITKSMLEDWIDVGFFENVRSQTNPNKIITKEVINGGKAKRLREGIKFGLPVVHQDFLDKRKDEILTLEEKVTELHKKSATEHAKNSYSQLYRELTKESQTLSQEINRLTRVANAEFSELKNKVLPESSKHQANLTNSWFHSAKKNKGYVTTYSFADIGKANFCEPIRTYCLEQLTTNYKEIFNHLNAEDNFLYVMATDKDFRSKFEPELLKEMDSHLSGVIAACGLLDELFDNNNCFNYRAGNKIEDYSIKSELLNVFPFEKLGCKSQQELNLKIINREIKQSDISSIIPDIYSEWISAQRSNVDMENDFNKDYKPLDVIAINQIKSLHNQDTDINEEKIEKTFDTESYLDGFINSFTPASKKTIPKPKDITKPAATVTEIKPQIVKKNQLSLF